MTSLSNPGRLAALTATGLVDSAPERDFDRITELASRLLGAPVALISLVDDRRQFFKSQVGLPPPYDVSRQTPLSHSFCQHVVTSRDILVITDAKTDPRVRDNLAVRDLNVQAYLGVPLTTADGNVLGSLCAIDGTPRQWSESDHAALRDLSELVMDVIELRAEIARREAAEQQTNLLIAELHHRVKNTLANVQAVIHMSLRSADNIETFRESIAARIGSLAKTHTLLGERQWDVVSFAELVDGELAPYRTAGRLTVSGPECLIAAQTAVTLGMVLHELTTNASKYGALSGDKGHLTLTWSLNADERNVRRLTLNWSESGGPRVVEPTRRGFGSTLLKRIIEGQLGGTARFDYKPEGIVFRAEVDLPAHA